MTPSKASRTSYLLQLQSLYWKNRSFLPTEVNADKHHHEYNDYHDFEGAEEDSKNRSPNPEWTFNSLIGIIHAEDCSICRSYATHILIASHSNEASFQQSLNARENRVTTSFSDGICAGRRLQQEQDSLQLACASKERDKALHSLEQKTKALEATRRESQALRDQVHALQLSINELSTRRDNDDVSPSTESSVETPESDLSLMEFRSSVEVDYVHALSTPPSSPADDHAILTVPDVTKLDVDSPKAKEAPLAEKTDTYNSDEYQLEPAPLHKPSASPKNQQRLSLPSSKTPSLQHPTTSTTVSTRASKSSRRFTTLAALQAAMNAAHEGDDSSLTAVRAFNASAHGAPRHKRTKLHKYVMKHWHDSSASSVRTTLDGDTFSTEIYVDASQWGIGFVMDGLWFSWKFTDSIIATLSGSQIDSNWAEMLAIEVGLWTVINWVYDVIQKGGVELKSLEILVRSDNVGVVKAIEKRHTNHPLQQDILQRILDMVSEYDIDLTMKWIPSMDNLADSTSRGVPGRVADLLPYIPPLPSHLSDMLCPISLN